MGVRVRLLWVHAQGGGWLRQSGGAVDGAGWEVYGSDDEVAVGSAYEARALSVCGFWPEERTRGLMLCLHYVQLLGGGNALLFCFARAGLQSLMCGWDGLRSELFWLSGFKGARRAERRSLHLTLLPFLAFTWLKGIREFMDRSSYMSFGLSYGAARCLCQQGVSE